MMNTYDVEFTDTYGGEANYCWVDRFQVTAKDMKQAVTKAKQHRYYSPLPKHVVDFNDGITARINITGSPVCAFITFNEE